MINKITGYLLGFLLILSVQNVFAQGVTTASINGIVSDDKGNPLPAATIFATHSPSGTQFGTTTREDGRYNLLGLKVGGPYVISVSYVGYSTQTLGDINLRLGEDRQMNFSLSEQAVELEDVTVLGNRNSIINSSRTGAAQNVTIKDIETIPTINRRFQDFSKLSPQFSGAEAGSFSGSGSIAAGRNNRYNNIQIDGTQYNDLFGLGATGTPGGQTNTTPISLDAIQEFQVVIAPYDVRLGSFTGGGINAITRSGSNTFTGSVYGYGRNENFVGNAGFKTDNPATAVNEEEFAEFKEYQAGVRIGGPVIKDKLFFFLNGEVSRRDQPLTNIALTQGPANAEELANSFASILRNQYSYDPGSYQAFTSEQPSDKLFARFDWNVAQNHKLTLRHNFVDAYRDILGGRTATNNLSFSSYNYRIKSQTNSTVAQLNSTFGNNFSNELTIGYTSIRDRRAGTSADAPEIQIRETGLTLFAGPDQYSSANELDQDILEITDNFSYLVGDHIFTIGTHNEFFSFRNLFLRAFFGYYQFATIADFQAGLPSAYARTISRTGNSQPAAEFDVNQFGFYAQDEWSVTPAFKLNIGLRVDIPVFPEAPARNDSVSKYFPGYATDDIPSGNLLFSPRLGFNWDINGDRSLQLRGGIGIFTGRVPYVWMSNNYGNTGTMTAEITQASGQNVQFTLDPNNLPGVGSLGTGAPSFRSEINLVDPDFKMPQIFRINVGVDRQLPFGFIGTLEFLYSKTMNDLIYEKVNLNPQASTDPTDGRPIFGGTSSGNNNFTNVLLLKNTSEGSQYNISLQLQGNIIEDLSTNFGYTYGNAEDQNSVLSSQALSQMRYNPVSGNPNEPGLSTSTFEIEHRIFVALTYVHEFFKNSPTTVSLYYNGQSGLPFSFIYQGDPNNDGFDANDLFYIPNNNEEILLGTLSNGVYTANQTMYDELNSFIENDDYLKENRGKIAERNGAKNPWRNTLDLKLTQDISLLNYGRLQLSLDVLNVLNLLNNEWGWDEGVFSTYQIARYQGRLADGRAVYSFSKPANNTAFASDDINSRWAMQFGVRYIF
jgi:hypothetical protein